VKRAALLAALACACASDFLVDDGTGGTTGGADTGSTTEVATTLPGTSSAEGGSSANDATTSTQESGGVEGTAEAGSTGAVEGSTGGVESTTTGVEATAEATLEASAGSTTGELPCAELGMDMCVATDGCAWEGELKMCVDDPCFDPTDGGSECFDMLYLDCVEVAGCAWMGMPEEGACAPNGCWECGAMSNEIDCTESEGCMWLEGKAACVPV
jgi:hypothetical protein